MNQTASPSLNVNAALQAGRCRRVMPRTCAVAGLEVMRQLEAATRAVESEVVLESETKTVGVAAQFCFAQFGSPPDSHDAPELSDGEMTERERQLATCLATPFEGNPEAEGSPHELTIVLGPDHQLTLQEVERKQLRALAMYRQRRRAVKKAPLEWNWMQLVHYFAWSKALKFIDGKY